VKNEWDAASVNCNMTFLLSAQSQCQYATVGMHCQRQSSGYIRQNYPWQLAPWV